MDRQLRNEPTIISTHPSHRLRLGCTRRYRQLTTVEKKGVR
jgi:hypothetical protein